MKFANVKVGDKMLCVVNKSDGEKSYFASEVIAVTKKRFTVRTSVGFDRHYVPQTFTKAGAEYPKPAIWDRTVLEIHELNAAGSALIKSERTNQKVKSAMRDTSMVLFNLATLNRDGEVDFVAEDIEKMEKSLHEIEATLERYWVKRD